MKKIAMMLTSIALVAAVAVGGTLAYLTDQTTEVTNTFTVGKVDIDLTEAAGGQDHQFQMIPGNTLTKDPKITVKQGSEECWVFVKVEKSSNLDTYIDYEMATGWTNISGTDVWYYSTSCNVGDELSVLKDNQVTVNGEVTSQQMTAAETNQPTLTFTAYAVQKANFETPQAAWTATFGAPTTQP